MAPRAMWTGQLRLSLVSFGVRLYAATESANRVSMNQLHRDCHQRLRTQLVCPTHGTVNREDVVKGYQYEKDSYVIVEPADLDAIRLESTKTIDLVQFVDEGDIDLLYVSSPYFLGPDGPVAEEAYRVIREAMARSGKVGLGTLVMHGREHVVALHAKDRGFLLTTLRYAAEVRSATECFKDVKNGEVDEEQLQLAESIISAKSAPFEPEAFRDRYREAFFDIVKAKIEGEAPVVVEDEPAPRAFSFMEALKESVAEAEQAGKTKKPAAKSVSRGRKKTAKKSSRKQA